MTFAGSPAQTTPVATRTVIFTDGYAPWPNERAAQDVAVLWLISKDGKEDAPKETEYTVAGKCCESGDILIQKIALPKAEQGDLLVMKTTGAYGYSMASHYNKLLLPAVVFSGNGKTRTVIRRETYEHLLSLEED